MTAQEFSSEFDLLYNNVGSGQAPGLTEYEKSVVLTKAQDEIIKNYFTNVQGGNKYQQGIEDSNKRYSDFSCLITVETLTATTGVGFDPRGKIFNLNSLSKPPMITITESFSTGASSSNNTLYQVVPIAFNEYMRLMSKPSADPLKRQVWKLMGNSSAGNGTIEIVPHWKDSSNTYNSLCLKYVRQPYPIILEDLTSQGLTIGGQAKPFSSGHTYSVTTITAENTSASPKVPGAYAVRDTTANVMLPAIYNWSADATAVVTALNSSTGVGECCELAKELHPEILQRAVELAKIFYSGDNQQIVTSGTRSE